MYSNNDFRYYKGGDYLAHYGKKGMKWKKKKGLLSVFNKKSDEKPVPNIKKKNTVNEYKHIKQRFAKDTIDENKRYAQLLKPQHKKLRKKLSKTHKPNYGGNVHNTILHNKVLLRRNNEKFGTNRMIRINSR